MSETKKGLTSQQKQLIAICVAVYFVSYLTRKNYSSVLANIGESFKITETAASFALTGMAIFYGTGQLLSGWLGDRTKPKYLIATGLFTTAAINGVLPFCSALPENVRIPLLTVFWSINGLAQAMMWPPIVKMLSSTLSTDEYKKATVKVSYGSQAATVAIYLFGYLSVRFSVWEYIFYVPAVLAAIAAVVVLIKAPDVGIVKREKTQTEKTTHAFPYLLLGSIMFVTMLQGIMRDGVADWLPTYIDDRFGISAENAILMGIAPPILSIVFYEITSYLSRRVFKNEMLCSAVIFGTGFLSSFVLSMFSESSVVLSVTMSTIVSASMHGVNLILTCMIPQYFSKTGRVAFIAGLINSCTYLGSALSGYGFAALAALIGWGGTIVGWAIICAVACVICLVMTRKWAKYKE